MALADVSAIKVPPGQIPEEVENCENPVRRNAPSPFNEGGGTMSPRFSIPQEQPTQSIEAEQPKRVTINDIPMEDNIPPSSAQTKRAAFAIKIQTISMDNPPKTEPVSFLTALYFAPFEFLGCAMFSLMLTVLFIGVLPIAKIIIGSIFIFEENCPSERIALLLVISGSMNVLMVAVHHASRSIPLGNDPVDLEKATDDDPPPRRRRLVKHPLIRLITGAGTLTSFVLYIVICVLVYKLHPHVHFEDRGNPSFCDVTLFQFAFWYATVPLIILGVVIIIVLILGCWYLGGRYCCRR